MYFLTFSNNTKLCIPMKKPLCPKLRKYFPISYEYREIPNISPGLIEVRKHFLGGLYLRGAYIRRAFCVSVRVSRPQNSLLYIAIIGKRGVSLGQNDLYFVLKPI